jgi:hypothetical protein
VEDAEVPHQGQTRFDRYIRRVEMKAFPNLDFHSLNQGMDLRDYFAAKALHGFIKEEFRQPTYEQMAQACYELADAMMKARKESSQNDTK